MQLVEQFPVRIGFFNIFDKKIFFALVLLELQHLLVPLYVLLVVQEHILKLMGHNNVIHVLKIHTTKQEVTNVANVVMEALLLLMELLVLSLMVVAFSIMKHLLLTFMQLPMIQIIIKVTLALMYSLKKLIHSILVSAIMKVLLKNVKVL
jgi:hypothetical protein